MFIQVMGAEFFREAEAEFSLLVLTLYNRYMDLLFENKIQKEGPLKVLVTKKAIHAFSLIPNRGYLVMSLPYNQENVLIAFQA